MMSLCRELSYTTHPYRWQTIGKELSHIENASLEDVKEFFYKHYAPNNAIVSICGNVDINQIKDLAERWFGDIPTRNVPPRNLPQEPIQEDYRNRRVERNVPNDMLIMAFHIDPVTSPRFRGFDLLSSILSKGSSSRLIYQLTKKRNIFTFVDAYVESQMDKGLLLIMGMPSSGVTIENAEVEIWKELDKLTKELVEEKELQKVKNAEISTHIFGQVSLKERATNLATFELMGNVEQINIMEQSYEAVTAQEIMELAKEIFKKERCSSLYYCAKKRDKNG